MKIISRQEAFTKGLKFYFTGKPCKYGHIAERFMAGMCRTCNELWRAERKDELKEYRKDWGLQNQTQEQENVRLLALYHDNLFVGRVVRHNSRAKARGDLNRLSPDIAKVRFDEQGGCCKYCKTDITEGWEIDHWMPAQLGGLNVDENIQLLCKHCNSSKEAQHPSDYERSIGYVK